MTHLLVNYFNPLLQVTENTTSLFVTNVTSASILYTSQHPMVIARTVIYCVVWPASIMFGIGGNTLSLVVLGKYGDSSSTSMFLKSLAVADTMTLLIRCVQMVFVWRELFWADQYLAWKLSSFSFVKCSHLSERIGNSITVAIVFERVVAVTRPFQYKNKCSSLRTAVIILMIHAVIVSTSLPNIVDIFMCDYNSVVNRTGFTSNTDDVQLYLVSRFSNSSKLISVLTTVNAFNRLVFDLMPIPIVILGNLIIIIQLRRNHDMKSKSTERQQQRKENERQLTKLLLMISTLFLILCGPAVIYAGLARTEILQFGNSLEATLGIDIVTTFILINSCINFIVYAVMNKKYNDGYKRVLRCFCRNSDNRCVSGNVYSNRNP